MSFDKEYGVIKDDHHPAQFKGYPEHSPKIFIEQRLCLYSICRKEFKSINGARMCPECYSRIHRETPKKVHKSR